MILLGRRSRLSRGLAMSLFRAKDSFQCLDQRRDVSLNGAPENVEVNIKVGVDQAVAHRDDVVPRNLGQLLPCGLGYLVGCLSDDFDVLHQRQYQLAVAVQVGTAVTCRELDGFLSGLPHLSLIHI